SHPTVLNVPETLWPVSRVKVAARSLKVRSSGPAPMTLSSAAPTGVTVAAASDSEPNANNAVAVRRIMFFLPGADLVESYRNPQRQSRLFAGSVLLGTPMSADIPG